MSYTGALPVRSLQRRLRALLACLCLILAPGAASADGKTRVAGSTYLGDLPTLVADRQGLFRDAGLDVAVTYSATGAENLERLRAGTTDFALMALTPVVLGLVTDESPGGSDDPVILANLVHGTGLNRIVTRADSGVRTGSDLAGRRLGLSRGTNAHFVWWLFARLHGLDPRSVTIVDRDVTALGEALVAGEIDAAVLWEPWIARLRESGPTSLQTLEPNAPDSARWVVVSLRANVREHPERARQVLAAYRQAIEFIERRPEAAAKLYADHARINRTSLEGSWSPLAYDLSMDWALIAALQQKLAWARRAGYPAPGRGGVLTVLDAGPLRSVAPGAVGLPETFAGAVAHQ